MKRRQLYEILGIMSASFMVTLWLLRPPAEVSTPQPALTAQVANSWQSIPSAPASAPAAAQAVGDVAATAPAADSAPAIVIPPADDNGPPLPLMVAISSHAGDAPSDDDAPAGEPQEQHEVDVINNSDDPMTLTVMAVDGGSQATSVAQVFIPPQGRAHIGDDEGLKLASGTLVTLRSNGFQEMTQSVD